MGSSCSGPAREARRGLTAKGRPPEVFKLLIYAASSLVTEAANAGGSPSTEVMREREESGAKGASAALFIVHHSFIIRSSFVH
jgi:hypothetical protein